MSSTQDPGAPAAEPNGSLEGTEPTQSTPSAPAGPITVDIEIMLYEAGMVANSLSSKSLGSALAQKLFEGEQEAEQAGHASFTFAMTPFEAGMALNSMSRSSDGLTEDLQGRLHQALVEKMQELGIEALPTQTGGGTLGGSLGGDEETGGSLGGDEDQGDAEAGTL